MGAAGDHARHLATGMATPLNRRQLLLKPLQQAGDRRRQPGGLRPCQINVVIAQATGRGQGHQPPRVESILHQQLFRQRDAKPLLRRANQ